MLLLLVLVLLCYCYSVCGIVVSVTHKTISIITVLDCTKMVLLT